ncbi:MAG: Dabb family protein [Cytophagales bacterium]
MSNNKFVHVVNFWLKKQLSEIQIQQFENGLKSIEKIESLIYFNVGKPADTDRPTIDKTYSYSMLTVFKDKAGHDLYQTHPLHLKFLEENKMLWDKVLIYDSETI